MHGIFCINLSYTLRPLLLLDSPLEASIFHQVQLHFGASLINERKVDFVMSLKCTYLHCDFHVKNWNKNAIIICTLLYTKHIFSLHVGIIFPCVVDFQIHQETRPSLKTIFHSWSVVYISAHRKMSLQFQLNCACFQGFAFHDIFLFFLLQYNFWTAL